MTEKIHSYLFKIANHLSKKSFHNVFRLIKNARIPICYQACIIKYLDIMWRHGKAKNENTSVKLNTLIYYKDNIQLHQLE